MSCIEEPSLGIGEDGGHVTTHVRHISANARDDTCKTLTKSRDKQFYDDKFLVIELYGSNEQGDACTRKKVCAISQLQKGVEIPVNVYQKAPQGQSVQLQVYIASEEENEALHVYASNSITLSDSGNISCQLNASGIVCTVHCRVELTTEKETKPVIELSDMTDEKTSDVSVFEMMQIRLLYRWHLYLCMLLLFIVLVTLANNAAKVARQADIEMYTRISSDLLLQIRPGDLLEPGDHFSGCYPFPEANVCKDSVLTMHRNGALSLYVGISKTELDENLKHCYGESSDELAHSNVALSTGQLETVRGSPNCIKPTWTSGGFVRWRELLKLRFGKYRSSIDTAGYLRIYKGQKEIWSSLIEPSSVMFPLISAGVADVVRSSDNNGRLHLEY